MSFSLVNAVDFIVGLLQLVPWWVYVLILFLAFFRYGIKRKSRHQQNIAKSKLILSNIEKIDNGAGVISYLRKIDYFVFEEVVLTAFKKLDSNLNIKIIRNKQYTGDGGIDGRVIINGEMYYIQAKRYKNHIAASHVHEFAKLCVTNKVKGLFVHTGKTGAKSKTYTLGVVDIISGERLTKMLTKNEFKPAI